MSSHNLSLVFVHGFRGDHSSFQSFPTDLHLHLSPLIPRLHTFVYPTYKTKRPLELARDNLLTWIQNLPEGGVILCGHSMGGLLTAEAALAAPPGRVIGLVSFDVPYLGVHPRVVLSGVASLFKKEDMKAYQTNTTNRLAGMLSESCNQTPPSTNPQEHQGSSLPDAHLGSGSSSSLHLSIPTPPVRVMAPRIERLFHTFSLGPVPQSVHNFLHFWEKHPGITGLKDGIVQIFEFGGCLLNPQGLIARYERLQRWSSDEEAGVYGRGWVNFWTTPVPQKDRTTGGVTAHSGPSSPRLQNHIPPLSSTPSEISLNSSSVQSSLFQTMSYDPSLSTSVTSLESTHSSADAESSVAAFPHKPQECISNTIPFPNEQTALKLEENVPRGPQETRREEKRLEKEKKIKAKKAQKERTAFLKTVLKRRAQEANRDPPQNFIVLPKRGTDHQWIRVPVVGAEDEITAHCGLFFRDENPGYQRLIEDVGNIVRGFWDGEGGLRHSRMEV
ncbi:hypothetical protein RSOLAG22IIIB_04874 [Rhizoctonia solani]|uniref:AB hydrolase-1 domain-containing protein n=1 Tax=Rhizoctonia solani TaxID=456999 RepID=A0A0K6G0X8_9AGAM|nr:hypothetical protein RSOLAG22IIIB_04874 [Rhizoctonia solani]